MANDWVKTAAPDRYALLKDFAKKNRKELTISESILWDALRDLKSGCRFRRQHPIGDYIVDFVCLKRKLVIEVDGGYHDLPLQQQEDQWRTDSLERMGYKVIRFSNEEINNNLQEVLERIKKELLNV